MSIVVLLTVDPALEREVERCIETWSEPPTLLPLGGFDAFQAVRHTLEGSPLLLVDLACFIPPFPEDPGGGCIGIHAGGGVEFPGPVLERPLRPLELHSWTAALASGSVSASPSRDSRAFLPTPFAEFQRDVVHDLNNQLTTVQGNLILLREDGDDPALADMAEAAEQAIALTEQLEWLGEGEFPSRGIPLRSFLESARPLWIRLRGRTCDIDVASIDPAVVVFADPSRLQAVLLLLIHAVPGTPSRLALNLSATEPPALTCRWEGGESVSADSVVPKSWLQTLGAELTMSANAWHLSLPPAA